MAILLSGHNGVTWEPVEFDEVNKSQDGQWHVEKYKMTKYSGQI